MKDKRHFTRLSGCRIFLNALIFILFLALTCTGSAQTSSSDPIFEKTVQVGGSELLDFKGIERLAVSDPSVIDYVVLSKIQMMLVAKKPGEANLYVWDQKSRYTYHVVVTPPPLHMAEIVEQIDKSISRRSVKVSEYQDVIILEGQVDTADESKRAEVIARAFAPKVENLLDVVAVPTSDVPLPAAPLIEKSLIVGKSELLDFQGIEKVTVSDPAVIDYVQLSKIQMMVLAKKAGDSQLYIWDKLGPHPYHVAVSPIPSQLPELIGQIKQAIDRPSVSVSEYNKKVILEGEVDNGDEVKRAEAIARVFTDDVVNLTRVRTAVVPVLDIEEIRRVMGTSIRISRLADGILLFEGVATTEERARLDQILKVLGNRITAIDMVTTSSAQLRQVMVHVKAVEINRSALKNLGVDWGGLNADGAHDQPILFGEETTGPFKLDAMGKFRRLEGISAQLEALITTNKARVLAEPNLLVVEGQLADILVGGQIPIPVVQSLGTSAGSVSVEWKDFGVRLAIKPLISTDGQIINLDVAPEVSNLDFGNAVVVGGIRLPALQTRKAHSVLNVRSGQTLVIGGLYQVEQSKTQRKIPLLGDIPVIGELFKRTDKQQRETELVVFVTPEIVTDASSAAQTQDSLRKMGESTDVNKPR